MAQTSGVFLTRLPSGYKNDAKDASAAAAAASTVADAGIADHERLRQDLDQGSAGSQISEEDEDVRKSESRRSRTEIDTSRVSEAASSDDGEGESEDAERTSSPRTTSASADQWLNGPAYDSDDFDTDLEDDFPPGNITRLLDY